MMALGSIVPGQAKLMSLHKRIPSPTLLKSSGESGLIGKRSAT